MEGRSRVTAPQAVPDYVVDTSVALKWFVEREEADVPQALRLQEASIAGRCTLRAPDLLLVELANALKLGRKLNVKDILEVLNCVRGFDLTLEAFRWATLAKAVEIASIYGHGVTVYDAYFLAVAIETSSVLVTADEAFLRRSGRHPNLISLRRLRLPI